MFLSSDQLGFRFFISVYTFTSFLSKIQQVIRYLKQINLLYLQINDPGRNYYYNVAYMFLTMKYVIF